MKPLTSRLKRLGPLLVQSNDPQAHRLTRKSIVIICLSIFFITVGVRLLQWQNNRLDLDKTMWRLTARYKESAQLLINGDLASFLRGSATASDTIVLAHPPGYPLLMALIYKLSGNSDAALRLFQIFCDACASLLIFLIASELLPNGVAIIAALLVALSPQFAYHSLLLLPDSLSVVPILIAFYLIVRAVNRRRIIMLIAAGASVGVSCWLRADALLLAPFLSLIVLVLFERGKWLSYCLALVGAALLVISPITIRNALVFHSFIPLSLGGGVILAEGVADYDSERRFGLEAKDDDVVRHEAELFNRPDYVNDLFSPDGIERERSRYARAWCVIRSNKLWFLGVMMRRAALMIEDEDVPVVSVEPSVTNSIEITNKTERVWSSDASELMSNRASASTKAELSMTEDNQALRIMGDESQQGKQFVSAPIQIEKRTDYLLRLPIKSEQGRMVIKVERVDDGATLASAIIPDSLEQTAPMKDSMTFALLPFVSGNANQVHIVMANANTEQARPIVNLGGGELFRIGPSLYLWTRYPRMLLKSAQKFFKTAWLLPLALFAIILLALSLRGQVLAVVLTVPVYYLVIHSPLHVEPRYVLGIHYFLSILVAVSLYWIATGLWRQTRTLLVSRRLRPARQNAKDAIAHRQSSSS
ncbi:MAG: hypothetical protein DMF68_00630 [Acidobacteria bacterium]|nr:MAG: hypothetical protein DMF68_00630 [Acidobacteriota bacterium]